MLREIVRKPTMRADVSTSDRGKQAATVRPCSTLPHMTECKT